MTTGRVSEGVGTTGSRVAVAVTVVAGVGEADALVATVAGLAVVLTGDGAPGVADPLDAALGVGDIEAACGWAAAPVGDEVADDVVVGDGDGVVDCIAVAVAVGVAVVALPFTAGTAARVLGAWLAWPAQDARPAHASPAATASRPVRMRRRRCAPHEVDRAPLAP
ncbi:MAG: hypothetical protein KGP12_02255 [Actinomycetales bacterium]|nr:hypothetical protein [Actinomycetales bacterium]